MKHMRVPAHMKCVDISGLASSNTNSMVNTSSPCALYALATASGHILKFEGKSYRLKEAASRLTRLTSTDDKHD